MSKLIYLLMYITLGYATVGVTGPEATAATVSRFCKLGYSIGWDLGEYVVGEKPGRFEASAYTNTCGTTMSSVWYQVGRLEESGIIPTGTMDAFCNSEHYVRAVGWEHNELLRWDSGKGCTDP